MGEGAEEEVAEEEGQEEGVEAGDEVVEHYAPAVGHAFHAAAKGCLEDVDDAEHGEAEEAEDGGLAGGAGDGGDDAGEPCADVFVNHYGAGVFAPVAFHHAGGPGADNHGDDHQRYGNPEQRGLGDEEIESVPEQQAEECREGAGGAGEEAGEAAGGENYVKPGGFPQGVVIVVAHFQLLFLWF